jgi:hypothetical protein
VQMTDTAKELDRVWAMIRVSKDSVLEELIEWGFSHEALNEGSIEINLSQWKRFVLGNIKFNILAHNGRNVGRQHENFRGWIIFTDIAVRYIVSHAIVNGRSSEIGAIRATVDTTRHGNKLLLGNDRTVQVSPLPSLQRHSMHSSQSSST